MFGGASGLDITAALVGLPVLTVLAGGSAFFDRAGGVRCSVGLGDLSDCAFYHITSNRLYHYLSLSLFLSPLTLLTRLITNMSVCS